jgi:antitoxin MazE
MYNSTMRIRLTKWGNSLGIRLPKIFAVEMGMRSGDEIQVDIRDCRMLRLPIATVKRIPEMFVARRYGKALHSCAG